MLFTQQGACPAGWLESCCGCGAAGSDHSAGVQVAVAPLWKPVWQRPAELDRCAPLSLAAPRLAHAQEYAQVHIEAPNRHV